MSAALHATMHYADRIDRVREMVAKHELARLRVEASLDVLAILERARKAELDDPDPRAAVRN